MRDALTKLQSLHDGDLGVVEVVAFGAAAIPFLREILFTREPSGLYETRRRAVEALTMLGAHETLRDFLKARRQIQDPAERTGEEAIVNAAARSLGRHGDRTDLPLLLGLLQESPLPGLIEAVDVFRCQEALPLYIEALGDDFSRKQAEQALLNLGPPARSVLFQTALDRVPPSGREIDSSKQRRRSALRLLLTLGVPSGLIWPPMRALIAETDPWIALLSCRVCLASGMEQEKTQAIDHLICLLSEPDGLLRSEIEEGLAAHMTIAAEPIVEAIERLAAADDPTLPWWQRDGSIAVLRRLLTKYENSDMSGDLKGELMQKDRTSAYRLGVGMMLLNRQRHVLLCRRVDTPNAWQMPQGGIDDNEEPRSAALRELKEEIGTDNAEILAESQHWYEYDVPAEYAQTKWNGRYVGQRHRWFLMQFKGQDGDINFDSEHPEFDRWIWVPPDHALDLVAEFKRDLYRKVLEEFREHLQPVRPVAPGWQNP
jgi:putative (di)nucleoside polyphosphate hydrolase